MVQAYGENVVVSVKPYSLTEAFEGSLRMALVQGGISVARLEVEISGSGPVCTEERNGTITTWLFSKEEITVSGKDSRGDPYNDTYKFKDLPEESIFFKKTQALKMGLHL
ncbi:MAG: hypothetical protein PHW76_08645 [Alphaproteobacteria bacterium]|nr:hypothetical protein [Alphaproteobacteria bacterium]